MSLIQLDLNQLLTTENQVPRNGQDILNESRRAKGSERSMGEHPMGNPSQRVVSHISQEHEGFLGRQAFLASFTELQSALISLDFGLTGTTVVVMGNDLGH